MKCANKPCSIEVGSHKTGSIFCSGKCKFQYRTGLDPEKCAHCQDGPRQERGFHVGFCSKRCEALHS